MPIQQSAADAGKVLGIGADGRVVPVPAFSGSGTAQIPENVVLFEEVTDSEDNDTVEALMLDKLKLESDGEYLTLAFGDVLLSRVPLPSGGGGSGSGTVYCTGVYIGGGNLILDVDSTEAHTISATVEPVDCTQVLRWSSDNKNAVTVDSNGNLKIVGEGSAIITATCGSFSDSVTVSVMNYYLDNVGFRANYAVNQSTDWQIYSQNTRGHAHLAGSPDQPIPINALKTYEINWDDIAADYPDLYGIRINPVTFSGATRITTYGWQGATWMGWHLTS